MDTRTLRKGAAFACLALMALTFTAVPSLAKQQQQDSQQSTGDPVADAARKAREQKKKDVAKPKRVYTDDDVDHLVSGSAPVSGDAGASAATEEGKAKKPQVQYYSDPQKALAEQYTRKDINDKDAKIAAKKKEIEQLKQQISDMEEALRKSGGDPGWAAP